VEIRAPAQSDTGVESPGSDASKNALVVNVVASCKQTFSEGVDNPVYDQSFLKHQPGLIE
jgi:hypothetical protein